MKEDVKMKTKTIKKYHLKKEVKDALIDAGIDLLGITAIAMWWYIFIIIM